MVLRASPESLAGQARRLYTEEFVKGLAELVQAALDGALALADKPSEHSSLQRRRELLKTLHAGAQAWYRGIVTGLRSACCPAPRRGRPADLRRPAAGWIRSRLVSDDTIELEIVTSRLALAIMDRASWEFSDLRSRVAHLERRAELDPHDMLRAHVLARIVIEAWRAAGLTLEDWRELQAVLHDEFAQLVEESYHETNRWLMEQGVLPEVDLRPHIRRSRTNPLAPLGWQAGTGWPPFVPNLPQVSGYGAWSGGDGVGDETRLMTRSGSVGRRRENAEAVLGRLNRLVGRHVPDFAPSTRSQGLAGPPHPMSPGLARAIETAQQGIRQRLAYTTQRGEPMVTAPVMLEEIYQRKQVLKQAAATPEERATIEIVALLFQSILTEDRIPATLRVWFARLQMPVLRVAVTEPDFFATIDHPARRLIDRMGACVMGFDSAGSGVSATANALDKEIKRVVQVVEAYPDTGRRVFQTVLTEFEKFLEHYFKSENEATRTRRLAGAAGRAARDAGHPVHDRAAPHAQRGAGAGRRAPVPVPRLGRRAGDDGGALRRPVRQTRRMKRAAADLIWSASAKVTREARAEVIQRLPQLLKSLREGMGAAGMDTAGRTSISSS